MRPDMTGALDAFDEMVEALEENEDLVECKECFDLFPKTDCEKSEVGYVCPVCKGLRAAPARTKFVDPYDCYTQDFPEVADYNPDAVVNYEREPDLGDALADLIKDEYEAIDGYEIADETIQKAEIEEDDKDEILDTLDHIKEEEEEHIDELKELCPECDKKDEAEDMVSEELADDAAIDDEEDSEDEGSAEPVADSRKLDEAADDEDADEEAEDSEENENEEVLDLESAYEAALEVANETGVGQVFGYAKKDTEEFVAIDILEVDDPEAIEQDLEAVYDDMGYAYVAFPEKTLEESLFESVRLHEASFLTNLFTRENQTLDAFFKNKFKVKTGNNTEASFPWAEAEKKAANNSITAPGKESKIIANVVSPAEAKAGNWNADIINQLCGKEVEMATYRNGKITMNQEVQKLLKQLKAGAKSAKISDRNASTMTTFNDAYGRTSLTDACKESAINPRAVAVMKLINILFDKFSIRRGLSHPNTGAEKTGDGIELLGPNLEKEYTAYKDAITDATTASNRKPNIADFDSSMEAAEGDLVVVELYGHLREFDEKILSMLERFITRADGSAPSLLPEATETNGPVHLFTFSAGKAIMDTDCGSIAKLRDMEANILEDLQEAGYDISGKPSTETPKKEEKSTEAEDDGDEDLDLDGESDGDTPKDPKEKLKAVLGDKKDPAGYTEESYAKYETLYEKVVAWIEGLKKPEAVTDEKIEGYKATAESKLVEDPDAGDADLDLEGDESESEGTTDSATETEEETGEETGEESGDKSSERGSAEFNKKYHGVNVANTAIQAFRKLMMLTSMKVYDAMGNEVTADLTGAKKITAETLNDFEVEVKGERQPLAAWISKMVKVGALHESFGTFFGTKLTEADEPAKTQKTSEKDYLKDQGITDAALSSFKKLFALTDLKVYDAFDKPVTADKTGMTKMSSYTLVDFTVDFRGKKVPLTKFVAKLAKEKILKESLCKAICEANCARPLLKEEYHKYANQAELAAMEDIDTLVSDAISELYSQLATWGFDAEEVDSQSWMCSENVSCLQYMVNFENLDPSEVEDLAEQIQSTLENIVKDYKCPAEIQGIDFEVALPDYDLADEDDAAQGITRASFLFYITFARNLF